MKDSAMKGSLKKGSLMKGSAMKGWAVKGWAMKSWAAAGGAGLIALAASIALAHEAPESLLPPGFDDPAPTPSPTPSARPAPRRPAGPAPRTVSEPPRPRSQPAPSLPPASPPASSSTSPSPPPAGPPLSSADSEMTDSDVLNLDQIPSVAELEEMSDGELDELLGLKSKYDIPPAARRSLSQIGILSAQEGGFAAASLGKQPAALVRAALEGTSGRLVSRWGHIVLRKVLASRLNAPEGMSAIEFAGLRAGLLNRMGEYQAARALIQDVDTGNWDAPFIEEALTAYVATADIVGACPIVRIKGGARKDGNWPMLRAICNAYIGEEERAGAQLDRALREEAASEIDILLAQRFAGAAGAGGRAVTIEWDDVDSLTPWRAALAQAVGEEIPARLRDNAASYYERVWALAPMVPLTLRAKGADRAAREGILSSAASVDLFSEIYANRSIGGETGARAQLLREAYVGAEPSARLDAMRSLWSEDTGDDTQAGEGDYGRYVLTAYAAARLPVETELSDDAAPIIASILSAGLDRDAALWSEIVNPGSQAWALLALGTNVSSLPVPAGDIQSYFGGDESANLRKSKLLLAGLAGLGRVTAADLEPLSAQLALDLTRQTRWSRRIVQAAQYRNAALVVLLAGLGMQGESWSKMTPLHLYAIVSSLNRVGLSGEARMIAAEAIARS